MPEYTIVSLKDPRLTDDERRRILALGEEDDAEDIGRMLSEAESVAAPVSACAMLPVSDKDDAGVSVGGVRIENELVREKLSSVWRAFPCINTCGRELENWSLKYKSDPLAEYWADEIKKLYLRRVMAEAQAYMKREYRIEGHFSSLNPGSLPAWPLSGQKSLFAVLGEEAIARDIGVRLTASLLMLPSKSTSGIWFESETPYQNCTYCRILSCPNRRAAFAG